MSVIYQVRQGIQQLESGSFMSMLIGTYGEHNKDKAYQHAKKESKLSNLPIFVMRVQKDRMASFTAGKRGD
ncbi:hypothetical protein KAR91_19625 [Candidatus Pacearchaeota archaeon]|nr:hypothetical protein [Candidatus Pacearchaeota archaeon]